MERRTQKPRRGNHKAQGRQSAVVFDHLSMVEFIFGRELAVYDDDNLFYFYQPRSNLHFLSSVNSSSDFRY